jgi:hypothetical protein
VAAPTSGSPGGQGSVRRTGRTGLDPGTRTIGRPVTCVSTVRRARIRHHLGGPYFALDSLAYARCPTYKPRHESQPLAYAKYGKLVDGISTRRQARAISASGRARRAVLLPRHTREVAASSLAAPTKSRVRVVRDPPPARRCARAGRPRADRLLRYPRRCCDRPRAGSRHTLGGMWSSFGTSRGRPWRGSSTARAMLCSTDSTAALASTAIGAAMAVVAALRLWTARGARGQRPSVLCEIRSQLRSL